MNSVFVLTLDDVVGIAVFAVLVVCSIAWVLTVWISTMISRIHAALEQIADANFKKTFTPDGLPDWYNWCVQMQNIAKRVLKRP